MLTHVVLLKLTDRSAENINKTRDVLLSMVGKIPQIKHMEVGVNIVPSDRAYDLALVQKFESLAAMQEYQTHPVHLPVRDYLRSVLAAQASVDYQD